jgi:glycosyltransferase involved in cell wall biosynthesis
MGEEMKISIFVKMFPPKRIGGTEIATFNIAKHLSKRHEVHVFTTLDEGLPKESYIEGFYVHRVPWPNIRLLGGLLFLINVTRLLKKIKPDIIHIQNIEFGKDIFLLNKILRKTFVIWARGSDINFLFIDKKNWLLKLVLKEADAVISLTYDMKKKIMEVYNREIFVIPNGIDLNIFEGLSKNELRNKFGLNKTQKIILYAGTLRPVKGLTYLIEAVKIINDKNNRLLLVGYGEEREHLENLVKKLKIENIVTFVGEVPNKEVFEYMTASDVLVLPSLSEGFPNVILEAMASGLPIIATKVGGVPEIINNEVNGFLIDPKNPQQICEKILLIFKDEKLREKISQNNKMEAKKYSWESVIDNLEKVYYKITDIKNR